ncbi:hypothetical protein HDV03_002502, partial [Kappamyces sp. JEL0829]
KRDVSDDRFSHPKSVCPAWERGDECEYGQRCRYRHSIHRDGCEHDPAEDDVNTNGESHGAGHDLITPPTTTPKPSPRSDGRKLSHTVSADLSFSRVVAENLQPAGAAADSHASRKDAGPVDSPSKVHSALPSPLSFSSLPSSAGPSSPLAAPPLLFHGQPAANYPALLELESKINRDADQTLWRDIDSSTSPDDLAMFREMLMFGLDRTVASDYTKYFDLKQKLAIYAPLLQQLVESEMALMGLNPESAGDVLAYHAIKAKMSQHKDRQEDVFFGEMPMLNLNPSSQLDRVVYFGIKKEISMSEE